MDGSGLFEVRLGVTTGVLVQVLVEEEKLGGKVEGGVGTVHHGAGESRDGLPVRLDRARHDDEARDGTRKVVQSGHPLDPALAPYEKFLMEVSRRHFRPGLIIVADEIRRNGS
jgi:hypothetical protein